MNDDTDPFIHFDAAYALGALSDDDRDDFEHRLTPLARAPRAPEAITQTGHVASTFATVTPLNRGSSVTVGQLPPYGDAPETLNVHVP